VARIRLAFIFPGFADGGYTPAFRMIWLYSLSSNITRGLCRRFFFPPVVAQVIIYRNPAPAFGAVDTNVILAVVFFSRADGCFASALGTRDFIHHLISHPE
jgi:hypothetical protein